MNLPKPDIIVHPTPTDEELAAIIAVLEVLRTEPETEPYHPPRSPWATAARHDSLRGT